MLSTVNSFGRVLKPVSTVGSRSLFIKFLTLKTIENYPIILIYGKKKGMFPVVHPKTAMHDVFILFHLYF